jgi:hypothetical protein
MDPPATPSTEGGAGHRVEPTRKGGMNMDVRKCWWLSLAALAVGCKSNDNLALLEAENRRLEDRVYQLESDLCQHCDLLDRLEDENRELKAQSGQRGSDIDDAYDGGASGGRPPRIDPGVPDLRGGPDEEPGPAPRFEGSDDAPKLPRRSAPERLFPVALQGPIPTPGEMDQLRVASIEVTRITIDRMSSATGASDRLAIAVEPRDAAGRMLKAAGELSVVVLDASNPDDAARLARWDYTAEEAASTFRRSALGERMHLDLTWPDAPPPGSNLRLFVRFTTADGRKLIADVPIELPAAAEGAAGEAMVVAHEERSPTGAEEPAAASGQPFPADAGPDDGGPLSTRRPRRKPAWSPYR